MFFRVWIDLEQFYEILFFILLLEPKGIFPEYDKSAPLGCDAPRDMRKIQDQGQLLSGSGQGGTGRPIGRPS
jgi:hypothetical protein